MSCYVLQVMLKMQLSLVCIEPVLLWLEVRFGILAFKLVFILSCLVGIETFNRLLVSSEILIFVSFIVFFISVFASAKCQGRYGFVVV